MILPKEIKNKSTGDEAVFALVHYHIPSFVGSQSQTQPGRPGFVWWKKNSITECFFGYGNIQQFHLSYLCTFARNKFVSTAEAGAGCCHCIPVFISLCVSWLRIRVAVIYIVAGLGILENQQEKDQHAATALFLDLNGIHASQIFCRESKSDLHNC